MNADWGGVPVFLTNQGFATHTKMTGEFEPMTEKDPTLLSHTSQLSHGKMPLFHLQN